MNHYLGHNVILDNTRIVRRRALPDGVEGEVLVTKGSRVNPKTVVASGSHSTDYLIFDIAAALNISPDDKERLSEVIQLQVGDVVERGQRLAVSKRRRRSIPRAPHDAEVSLVEHGRIILQSQPEEIEVMARLEGDVIEVDPGHSATIEAQGALMQCAWGNGHFASVLFAFEPGFEYGNTSGGKKSGLAELMGQDVTLSPYRGKMMVLMRMLTELDLDVVIDQEINGIVAPSAHAHLREKALQLKVPVILTEGFGNLPPSTRLYDILYEKRSNAAIFDAALPDHRNNIRPEIIIPGMARQDRPSMDATTPVSPGTRVRMRRTPYAGRIGKIVDLPELPVVIESGLRVFCAQVQLQSGDVVTVPLANLESLGEIPK